MKYNLVYKLLFIETNLRNFIYYLPYALALDDIVKGKSKYGVGFYVENDIQKPNDLDQRFDYFWGHEGIKRIYYEHHLLPGIKAKMLLDMSEDKYSIHVNKWYYRLARYRFENVWPPGQHFTNLITLKLLRNNILTLHCASFSDRKTKEGFLIFGASNTGKSLTTFKALGEGYQYHSEDLTIADKNYIYTSPLISAQSEMLPRKSLFLKYNLLVHKLVGLNMILPKVRALSDFREFFSRHNVNSKAKLKKIFILEKGKESIRKLSKDEAFRKILILNRLELSYYKDHLFQSYSYFNKDLNIEEVAESEKNLIRQIVDKSECFLVKSNSPERYFALIKRLVK